MFENRHYLWPYGICQIAAGLGCQRGTTRWGVITGCPLTTKIKQCITSDADRRSLPEQRGRVPDDQPEWIRLACQQQGERIRKAREYANLSQEKLAERAGLGRSTIQRIETGEGIKYVHLLRVAKALGLEFSALTG